ncbi:MAG: beta-galactosidase [Proteobacteria bacterium]|nr:beta-galactosidase [Pseudomonadota bacterium]
MMKLGVCYYPEQWPETMWQDDITRMRDTGLSLVRLGEFAWSRYEPTPGQYNWDWLTRILDIIDAAGLKAILGTPTATPPHWLLKAHPEILPVGPDGQTRGFGSRRHYCFSSAIYRDFCTQIVTAMAQKFGKHPALVAWQIDNEYGCHDTIMSYTKAALLGFQNWCRRRYSKIETLNSDWGNVFWSMEYEDFDAIELPNLAVTELNPAHRLAFWRYSSEQVVVFNRLQADILRKFSPNIPLVHNYMGFFTQFDHFDVGKDLDIASWDSYPLGFLDQSWADATTKETYLRTGHPDFTAFHHDLYRGVGRGRWWVMEQQPGPVNWAPHNPAPLPGMVRLWAWEAFAHGAELVSFFRWRQAPFAQEQFHAGLNLPNNMPDMGLFEAKQVADEIKTLLPYAKNQAVQSKIAMIFDYASDASLRIAAQGRSYDPLRWFMEIYAVLRSSGQMIDIVPNTADLEPYRCVILPNLVHCPASLLDKLLVFQGQIIIGPRTGSKTAEFQIPQELPPGSLQSLIPLQVTRVESLASHIRMPLEIDHQPCYASCWREQVLTQLHAVAKFEDGWGALYQHKNVSYIAACLDEQGLRLILKKILDPHGFALQFENNGLRRSRLGKLNFAFNYGQDTITLDHNSKYLVGQAQLKPTELAIWLAE